RAAAITQQLLAFSRQQIRKRTVIDVREAIADVAPLMRRLLGEAVELDFQVSGDAGRILADRNQLDQVLINLAVNARDAMPAGGTLSLAAEVVHLDADFGRTHGLSTLRTGPYTQITVSDDGTGMDSATRERAFEPFFSTKPTGKGTGLGLSTVYGIVKQSDGYIWLHSEPGSGTTVRIHLPAVADEVTRSTAESPAVRGGRETILVVEDEEVVRRLAASVLEVQGYNVLMAEDGQEGLEVLHESASRVDLVLCDTVMPRLNGREFARRAHELYPSLPVLFMSGYASQDVADRGLLEREASFLQKPFSPDALTRYVRDLLDSRHLRRA
ncbi:MAG: response regulator, partial [Gemmatimonadales bacterium]